MCDNGANVNAAASYSHVSPLHRAVEEGHEECAAVLIELKADLEARTKEGFTPLHEAVRSGSMALVRLLLESQGKIDAYHDAAYDLRPCRPSLCELNLQRSLLAPAHLNLERTSRALDVVGGISSVLLQWK